MVKAMKLQVVSVLKFHGILEGKGVWRYELGNILFQETDVGITKSMNLQANDSLITGLDLRLEISTRKSQYIELGEINKVG